MNLERAMAAHVRFGGHFVQVSGACEGWNGTDFLQAHVDGTARIVGREADGESVRLMVDASHSETNGPIFSLFEIYFHEGVIQESPSGMGLWSRLTTSLERIKQTAFDMSAMAE